MLVRMTGLEIGSYKLTSKLGEGGMGEVWIGEHKLLPRKAAVKLLLKELAANETIVARFINEAKATSQIDHPGIVKIIDFGRTRDHTYMIMELLEGETLFARGRKVGRFAVDDAIALTRQMAEALEAAHARHVVHRDLKPENLFLVPDQTAPRGERVKILDFGIAKMLDPTMGAPHTRTGSVLGTPVYMSPEQCAAQPNIDHRSDIYALGCVFFQLLCGRPPFDLSGVGELLAAHVYSAPPAPSELREGLSPRLDALVLRMLAKKPDDRFASMADVVRALDAGGIEPDAPVAVAAATRRTLTPPAGVPLQRSDSAATTLADAPRPGEVKPDPALAPPRRTVPDPETAPDATAPKRNTTLGGMPQPAPRRSSSLVVMGIAFVVTAALALGAFFVLSRGGR
jgi:eukaryotic-like serine/threonine-protein kinase